MDRTIEVIAYSGYRGDEEPRVVVIDGERRAVLEVRRRWRSPDGRYFDVELDGDRRLTLRHAAAGGVWSPTRATIGYSRSRPSLRKPAGSRDLDDS